MFTFHLILSGPLDTRLLGTSRDLIDGISSLLVFVANIHIARHVDIDGISRVLSNTPDEDLYLQSVNSARLLVRTLEAAMQSLYDDGSTLLLKVQGIRHSDSREELEATRDYLDAISTCMQANLDVVCQTLDSLLAIGHDQADLSQGDYNGSIEWRMSRISIATPTQATHRPTSGSSMIDIATAFNTQRMPQASLVVPSSEAPSGAFSDRDTDPGMEHDSQPCICSIMTSSS